MTDKEKKSLSYMKKKAIELFYNNKLDCTVNQDFLIKKEYVRFYYTEYRQRKYLNVIVNNMYPVETFNSRGIMECNLDKNSQNIFTNKNESNLYELEVLYVKLGSCLAEKLNLNTDGYYHFNRKFLIPNSILAFREVKFNL